MPSPHGVGPGGSRLVASSRAARIHGSWRGSGGAGSGAVSRRNRSIAAATAAASSGEAPGATISSLGRRFMAPGYRRRPVSGLPVLSHDAVLRAVSPADAIARVREAFLRHHAGDWVMPSKVYLESPGLGDFRAMPARGDGLALL